MVDEPIYKAREMTTVRTMLKRILAIAAGIMLGSVLAISLTHLVTALGWWPPREINRNGAYLREVMSLVNAQYVEADVVELKELTESALRGMLSRLDPHSAFLPARDYLALQEEMNNEFGGIGVQVERREERVVVIAPIAGTPGERAGVMRGDEIVAVDGENVVGQRMDEVVGKLRGPAGEVVKIGFWRPGVEAQVDVEIVREVIKVESVRRVQVLEGGIGYVQLTQFAERTGAEFAAALEELAAAGATALVLDLRNNPGGLLASAVAVAEPFFDRGELIVYTQGRREGDRADFRAQEARWVGVDWPVAVLINAGSASAAEIIAGALQDTGRAVVVGERSFGKGSVQSIFRLRDGEGLRLTTARYFTPGGATIHERGITPDVELVMTPEEDRNVALQRARDDVTEAAVFEERFGFAPVADRQLAAALDVLRAAALVGGRTIAWNDDGAQQRAAGLASGNRPRCEGEWATRAGVLGAPAKHWPVTNDPWCGGERAGLGSTRRGAG